MTKTNDLQAALDAGAALAEHSRIEDVPVIIVPEGYKALELAHLLPAPQRKTGVAKLLDLESFSRFVTENKSDCTRIYGTHNPPNFVAVLNDHGAGGPGWRDYRATYSCPISAEWATWTKASGRRMSQEEFATFIEDNARDIVTPSAADMLEISRTLQAKKSVNFSSGIRLDNGEHQLKYEEQIEGSAGRQGDLRIPETFVIGLPFTQGGPGYQLKARLRYRIDKSDLQMWFDLDAPHKIVEDAVAELFSFVEQGTGIKVFNGTV